MIPESLSRIPGASAHGAALAARTDAPEADTADVVDSPLFVERVNAYGFQADVMPTGTPWWVPTVHPRSVTVLSTGVGVTWQL